MIIRKANICYTYTSTYEGPLYPSELLAHIFLQTRITDCVLETNGLFYHYKDNKIVSDKLDYKISVDNLRFVVSIENWPEGDFLRENLYQYLINLFFENKHFSFSTGYIDTSYLRFSMGEIVLSNKKGNVVNLYPTITLYVSGVFVVELRAIIDSDIDVDSFVDYFVNLYNRQFDHCYVVEHISKFSNLINQHVDATNEKFVDNNNAFPFELFSIKLDNDTPITLTSVVLHIGNIVEYILNLPTKTGKFRQHTFSFQDYWVGKPHIHLLKFRNQKKTASDNLDFHKDDITKIFLRVPYSKSELKKSANMVDCRVFEDFSTIFSSALTLNIWSKNGIEKNTQSEDKDYNFSVYINQVVSRFLDFYYMLYMKSILIINKARTIKEILRYQSDFYYLKNDYLNIPKTGELRSLFNYAFIELGMNKHEEIVNNLLEIKKAEIENRRNSMFNRASMAISAFFGLISSGTFANDIIVPVWKLLEFPRFYNSNLNDIVSWIISFSLIFTASRIIMKNIKK